MAADAVHLSEKLLPGRDCIGVIVVKLGARIECRLLLATVPDRVRTLTRRDGLTDRLGSAVAFFPVARAKQERRSANKEKTSAEG